MGIKKDFEGEIKRDFDGEIKRVERDLSGIGQGKRDLSGN